MSRSITRVKKVGAAVAKSDATIYQAATDGFFIGVITGGTSVSCGRIVAVSDASATPTVEVGAANLAINTSATAQSSVCTKGGFCVPIRKGDYYKGTLTSSFSGTTATASYSFIPFY